MLENDDTGAQTEQHQKRMMGEIAKLIAGSNGALDPADYDRTVKTLLGAGSEPVITKKPEGAWTHVVTGRRLAVKPNPVPAAPGPGIRYKRRPSARPPSRSFAAERGACPASPPTRVAAVGVSGVIALTRAVVEGRRSLPALSARPV